MTSTIKSIKFSGYSQENNEEVDLRSIHTFYHNYKISCSLISPSLITKQLNKDMYNRELVNYNEQQQEYFINFSKNKSENLECYLKDNWIMLFKDLSEF